MDMRKLKGTIVKKAITLSYNQTSNEYYCLVTTFELNIINNFFKFSKSVMKLIFLIFFFVFVNQIRTKYYKLFFGTFDLKKNVKVCCFCEFEVNLHFKNG